MKTIWIIAGAVVLCAGLYFGVTHFMTSKNEKAGAQADKATAENASSTPSVLGLNASSSEEDVIDVMHKMSHQKIKADQKWGAAVLSQKNAAEVYALINNSHFKDKSDLLEIAERWKNRDFNSAVSDHNYFWKKLKGTIGKAYGKLSAEEEHTYCVKEYGEETAAAMVASNDLAPVKQ
ncbi:DUF6241 domain-containing protein [Metabacillus sp. GX 13764]|uniref:DUF6241 domain-containing protein n=1 Tax=Metabacillus kandeliae TaxID=2900151 RepID=UPI001E2A08DE|nr:DUF6241 domain-containing protein [Metabacillus kandeliae]MCD7035091.1 DUF6241 domain-containing protein [Metabacillus kandeliae]